MSYTIVKALRPPDTRTHTLRMPRDLNKPEIKKTDGRLQFASMDGTCYIISTQGTLDIVGYLATNVV